MTDQKLRIFQTSDNGKIHALRDKTTSLCGRASIAAGQHINSADEQTFMLDARTCGRCRMVIEQNTKDRKPNSQEGRMAASTESTTTEIELPNVNVRVNKDGVVIEVASPDEAIEVGMAFLNAGIGELQTEYKEKV